jgi:hypothetical protein
VDWACDELGQLVWGSDTKAEREADLTSNLSSSHPWAPLNSTARKPSQAPTLYKNPLLFLRNDSGQAHFTVKMPVRKEGGRSARLLILYSVPVVNI